MGAWILCVSLEVQMARTCWETGSNAQCLEAMDRWVNRVWAWERRSKIEHPSALAMCYPEISREARAARGPHPEG